MAHAQSDMRSRGAILAAASLIGAPVEVSDSDGWDVRDGVVHVGLARFGGRLDPNTLVAETLLLLWESVREVRVAPLRRARRLALAGQRPELEPMLAAIDRMLAAVDLVTAMPGLRVPVAQAIWRAVPGVPGELPRHLQWVCALLVATVDLPASERLTQSLAPDVQQELAALSLTHAPGAPHAAHLLRVALSPGSARSGMERFERVYGVAVPPYERLLERDLGERGLVTRGSELGGINEATGDALTAGSSGGGSSDDAKPGGEAEDAASDGSGESARAGDRHEGAEGSDLFEAEQAGFVQTVLSTPLPASGRWVDGLELPDTEAAVIDSGSRENLGGGSRGSATSSLAEYRQRRRARADSIDELRAVWERVIADHIAMRSTITRVAEREGELLDRGGLVRIVSEVVSGVERPRAFLSRRRVPQRARRTGSTDYVLLVDRSSSMQGLQAEAAADAALIMIESLAAVERDIAAQERALGIDLELSLRTALIVFDSTPVVVKPLSGALDDGIRARLYSEVRTPRGSTDDAAALRAAHTEFRRASGAGGAIERRRVAILVSDGGSDDAAAAAHEMRALRADGVTVFGLGLRTGDLRARYAPDGAQLDDPMLLPSELARLVRRAGLDELRPRHTR